MDNNKFPHMVTVVVNGSTIMERSHRFAELYQWCADTLGNETDWIHSWKDNLLVNPSFLEVRFRHREAAVLFELTHG